MLFTRPTTSPMQPQLDADRLPTSPSSECWFCEEPITAEQRDQQDTRPLFAVRTGSLFDLRETIH